MSRGRDLQIPTAEDIAWARQKFNARVLSSTGLQNG
jgi:hypothetical protein